MAQATIVIPAKAGIPFSTLGVWQALAQPEVRNWRKTAFACPVNLRTGGTFHPSMRDKRKQRAEQRERHAREVEASQKALRKSISETERLVDESDQMLRRHREEREDPK